MGIAWGWQLNSKVRGGAFTPSGTSAGSCREQAPKIGLCHLLPNGFSVVVDPWQKGTDGLSDAQCAMFWMFSMNCWCSCYNMPNQTWTKDIKSWGINLDLGDNMCQHWENVYKNKPKTWKHISTESSDVIPVCFRHSNTQTQSRSLLLIALSVRVSIPAFRSARCVIFLMKVWQKGAVVPSTEKFLSPTRRFCSKFCAVAIFFGWSFSWFVRIFKNLGTERGGQNMPKHGCRQSADLKLRRICRSIPLSWQLPEIAGSGCHRRQFQADHIIISLAFWQQQDSSMLIGSLQPASAKSVASHWKS